MLVAILSLLGVPLWLTLGWLAGALWHRREIKKLPGLFKCKVRLLKGTYRYVDEEYSRIPLYGFWAHDILIVEKGMGLARNLHFPVKDGVQEGQTAVTNLVKGLGDNPVTVQFRLDNDAVIEVAAAGEDGNFAQGSFFYNSKA